MESKECKKCKWKNECVNVNKFKKGDCLQYKKTRKRVS